MIDEQTDAHVALAALFDQLAPQQQQYALAALRRMQTADHHTGPFGWLLGIHFVERGANHAVCEMQVEPGHFNPGGVAHGGVVYSLLDSAMGAPVFMGLPPDKRCVTAELKVNYLRPIHPGRLRATGTVLHQGSTLAVVSGLAHDEKGDVVAVAQGTFAIIQRH